MLKHAQQIKHACMANLLEALTAGPHQEEKYARVTVYRGKKRRCMWKRKEKSRIWFNCDTNKGGQFCKNSSKTAPNVIRALFL
jgi:hypothetical protein